MSTDKQTQLQMMIRKLEQNGDAWITEIHNTEQNVELASISLITELLLVKLMSTLGAVSVEPEELFNTAWDQVIRWHKNHTGTPEQRSAWKNYQTQQEIISQLQSAGMNAFTPLESADMIRCYGKKTADGTYQLTLWKSTAVAEMYIISCHTPWSYTYNFSNTLQGASQEYADHLSWIRQA